MALHLLNNTTTRRDVLKDSRWYVSDMTWIILVFIAFVMGTALILAPTGTEEWRQSHEQHQARQISLLKNQLLEQAGETGPLSRYATQRYCVEKYNENLCIITILRCGKTCLGQLDSNTQSLLLRKLAQIKPQVPSNRRQPASTGHTLSRSL